MPPSHAEEGVGRRIMMFVPTRRPPRISMTNPKHNGPGHDDSEIEAAAAHERPETGAVLPDDRNDEVVTVAATVGIVAVGVALFEVALLPGMAIGVAAMLAPKYVPKMGRRSLRCSSRR